MVTTKETGLNPNAKVWQEIPAHQDAITEGTDHSFWMHSYPPNSDMSEDVVSSGGKGCTPDFPDNSDPEELVNGTDPSDTGCLAGSPQSQPAVVAPGEQAMPESLRESLKRHLEFCFSRENLSHDQYLISQMDGDQFVPIWTVACMEDIKALTSDMDLILDVLRESPMVQVDEAGEKVRPNHSRSIIILREVPESTPVEEVEALFKSQHCPHVLSAEFAHNSNWYITFQSDMDALKAYRYLREEVKVFQGKPIMARIKAINTFFAKPGFSSLDSSVYNQHGQPPAPYGSPVYMQQVYPAQQQYPVYPTLVQSWNPTSTPYFETPLAPFPNSGFMTTYNRVGNYKANSSSNPAVSRGRNHIKAHFRPGNALVSPPLAPPTLMDGHLGPFSSQPLLTSVSLPSLSPKNTSPKATTPGGELNVDGRNRRSNTYRGMRRKRDDEQNMRSVSGMEAEMLPPPNFNLAASNFPPLPGCVVSVAEETTPEMRLSDVVRGLKLVAHKVNQVKQSNISQLPSPSPGSPDVKASEVVPQTPAQPATRLSSPVKEVDEVDDAIPKDTSPAINPVTPPEPSPSSCSHAAPSPTSEQEPRKLSYAEVCQRLAKDAPPPAHTPCSAPPASTAVQPLQELKVNRGEDPRANNRHVADKSEKGGDARPPRQASRSFAGFSRPSRSGGGGLKTREHPRGENKTFFPQRGVRRSGKEQNIPPVSPK
ncbi:la-related protein 4 isoform X2 [Dunckerocampus dactyliophorus]|uniref:la-related protein 4 isoform X2 n=1 Tax=Dunckerocampus dactyliophorus TaxID=161453 RepID=UPI0024051534|nr:la-related protein 4 isoform X2 [Dunckerocampus dactyliophorus]